MEPIAQTNIQLFNQLRAQGRSLDEILVVRRAYQFLMQVYAGYYQADGKPFVAHTIGVASILGHLGAPADSVAAGLLHNVYGNGNFGDGRGSGSSESRRRVVRDAVGDRVEALLFRFPQLRITPRTLESITSRLDRLDATDRDLLLMDLADYLEKYVDLGVLYYGDNRWATRPVAEYGAELVEIARRLGHPKLAGMLTEAFERAASAAAEFPESLRTTNRYLELIVPRSCRRRLYPRLRQGLRYTLRRVRSMFRARRAAHPPSP